MFTSFLYFQLLLSVQVASFKGFQKKLECSSDMSGNNLTKADIIGAAMAMVNDIQFNFCFFLFCLTSRNNIYKTVKAGDLHFY